MPLGTVITRFRWPASITTYAVITLVTDPIGRSVTDALDQRSAPVAWFASSAHRERTPGGPFAVARVGAAWVGAAAFAAARAGGPPAMVITATVAATTAPAASRPAIRIRALPHFCAQLNIFCQCGTAVAVGSGRLRLSFLPNGRVASREQPCRVVWAARAGSGG